MGFALWQPQFVAHGQAPGPATVGASCVYVLRRADGYFYAGSTDALHDRIRAHRQVDSLHATHRGPCTSNLCNGGCSGDLAPVTAVVAVHVPTWTGGPSAAAPPDVYANTYTRCFAPGPRGGRPQAHLLCQVLSVPPAALKAIPQRTRWPRAVCLAPQRTGRGGPGMALVYLSLGRSRDAAALGEAAAARRWPAARAVARSTADQHAATSWVRMHTLPPHCMWTPGPHYQPEPPYCLVLCRPPAMQLRPSKPPSSASCSTVASRWCRPPMHGGATSQSTALAVVLALGRQPWRLRAICDVSA